MSSKDQIQRFIFDHLGVRGQLAGLHDTYLEATANHDYPEAVQKLLGEFMAAAVLLSTTIKFKGSLTLQAQGAGPLSLIMAECRNDQGVRGIARCKEQSITEDFHLLLGEGRLAITITPDKGQRYQGIIALEGDSLAACIENYFDRSEQLPTRVWLSAEPGVSASGLLIQVLPGAQDSVTDCDGWARICQLSDTLTTQELQQLNNQDILHRLYHEEAVRVFPVSSIGFKCTCSAFRTLEAIVSMGTEEIEEIFSAQPQLTVRCEFCSTAYEVTLADVEQHLGDRDDANNGATLH